jgi:hypothetical protein
VPGQSGACGLHVEMSNRKRKKCRERLNDDARTTTGYGPPRGGGFCDIVSSQALGRAGHLITRTTTRDPACGAPPAGGRVWAYEGDGA